MGWKKIVSGISGDKKQEFLDSQECPWKFDCPSHVIETGVPRPVKLKPKLRFLERIQPNVYKWQCKYCGMVFVTGQEKGSMSEREWGTKKNPALIGGSKVI